MPTLKQKRAFDKVVENGGNVSRAMIDTKYSKATAKTPQKLTNSKGWQELMKQYLPDKLLAQKHQELLNVPKKVRKFIKGDLEYEYEELDSQAISKGLDMAYKLKRRYGDEGQGDRNVTINLINLDSYGDDNPLPLRAKVIPNPLPKKQKEIQDINSSQESGKEQDSVKLTDMEGLQE